MSVYQRLLGRELPSRLRDLIDIPTAPMPAWQQEQLDQRASRGTATTTDLLRLGLGCLAADQWGAARRHLQYACRRDPNDWASRVGLAATCEATGQHDEAAAQLDAALANQQAAPV